ncbi:transcriptional regulator [Bacillus glycinifermentans]|uniref:Transcriptional regulator n=1 Tax=Bacillus glycinifermentans TaxID=1664069 RepID=A0A0J6H0G4_9BACI|nr:MerR family transcriptional regulator [Bacillus glycinifermentans]ATH92901.1 MerR family transcriptional regulator [Bacillus glycinifermentans]KMM58508.1 transcriptional regulator [Bacillus glycinifermentans]KRT88710.1 transcriptional regulator [Bacillus glycinifermentans]MEC0488130.1 MerR family transcriptional regulator [Bacillus glycinifermentans]MEC0497204.1 MerR family transcriptional regulator [Bacillus glycinifermentans]
MNIKEAVERTGLSAHTIRFYERSGLIQIKRSAGGIRQFTDSDVNFLTFIATLKKTGMSLEDISEFTKEGCILERLESGEIQKEKVNNRLSILMEHRNKLIEQQKNIEVFINTVNQKILFYEEYIYKKAGEDF